MASVMVNAKLGLLRKMVLADVPVPEVETDTGLVMETPASVLSVLPAPALALTVNWSRALTRPPTVFAIVTRLFLVLVKVQAAAELVVLRPAVAVRVALFVVNVGEPVTAAQEILDEVSQLVVAASTMVSVLVVDVTDI